jgi:hypothetical protein
MLERKIKGPCWLEIKNFVVIEESSSWAKNRISCADMNTANNRNEEVQISCFSRFYFDRPNKQLVTRQYCGLTRSSNKNWLFDMQASLRKFNRFKIFKFDNPLSWFLSIIKHLCRLRRHIRLQRLSLPGARNRSNLNI